MIGNEGWLKTRWWEPKDLIKLVMLYDECFPNENWMQQDFLDCVQRKGRTNVLKVLEAEDSGRIIGSILYEMTKTECRIRRIAIAEESRRQGYARHMVANLTNPQSQLRRNLVTARVRECYLDGQLFFRDLFQGPDNDGPVFRHQAGDIRAFTSGPAAGERAIWFRLVREFSMPRQLVAV
jgi:hypothetical protein